MSDDEHPLAPFRALVAPYSVPGELAIVRDREPTAAELGDDDFDWVFEAVPSAVDRCSFCVTLAADSTGRNWFGIDLESWERVSIRLGLPSGPPTSFVAAYIEPSLTAQEALDLILAVIAGRVRVRCLTRGHRLVGTGAEVASDSGSRQLPGPQTSLAATIGLADLTWLAYRAW